jgi:hypothetical protein
MDPKGLTKSLELGADLLVIGIIEVLLPNWAGIEALFSVLAERPPLESPN